MKKKKPVNNLENKISDELKEKFKNAFNKLTDEQKKAAMDAIRNCNIKIGDISEIGVVSKKNLVDIDNKLLMAGIHRSIISLKDAVIRQICYIADNESRWPLICSHTSESLTSALTKAIDERWDEFVSLSTEIETLNNMSGSLRPTEFDEIYFNKKEIVRSYHTDSFKYKAVKLIESIANDFFQIIGEDLWAAINKDEDTFVEYFINNKSNKQKLSDFINKKLRALAIATPMIMDKFKRACEFDPQVNWLHRLSDEEKKDALKCVFMTLRQELDKPNSIVSKLSANYVHKTTKQTEIDKAFDFYIGALFYKGVAFYHYSKIKEAE